MFSQSQGALGSEYQQQQDGSTTHTVKDQISFLPPFPLSLHEYNALYPPPLGTATPTEGPGAPIEIIAKPTALGCVQPQSFSIKVALFPPSPLFPSPFLHRDPRRGEHSVSNSRTGFQGGVICYLFFLLFLSFFLSPSKAGGSCDGKDVLAGEGRCACFSEL